jgi:hypothetical protein
VLAFKVLIDGKSPPELDLDQVYLASQEGQPVRARFTYAAETGLLFCDRRSQGLASLNLSWPVRGGSRLMLRTALVPDRDEPYLLTLELARGRLADVWRKKDEWGYAFGSPGEGLEKEFRDLRLLLAQAETVQDAALAASDLAEETLSRAVALGERLALEDSKHGLSQRRQRGELSHVDLGCHWDLADPDSRAQERFGAAFNCATLPLVWRVIEPREHEFNWKWSDDWVQWLEAKGIAIKGGSLVRFCEGQLPDWVWIWENDFETIRDCVFDHVEQVVRRYRGRVDCWDAVTGLHVENCMDFSLDRIIEITRIACHAVKRTDPAARVGLELIQPWGEYYAVNQRSIWPYHYAEMCINAGVVFDVIGLQVFAGAAGQGFHARDMLDISDLLDRFGGLGKPVHLTAVGAPRPARPTRRRPPTAPPTGRAPAASGANPGTRPSSPTGSMRSAASPSPSPSSPAWRGATSPTTSRTACRTAACCARTSSPRSPTSASWASSRKSGPRAPSGPRTPTSSGRKCEAWGGMVTLFA